MTEAAEPTHKPSGSVQLWISDEERGRMCNCSPHVGERWSWGGGGVQVNEGSTRYPSIQFQGQFPPEKDVCEKDRT